MKVKITYIILKKDNAVSITNSNHLKVYLNDENNFPSRYISTKNEIETLKQISDEHLYIEFDWIKKELFSFEVLNNQESEVIYLAHLPHITEAEKNGSFYTLAELSDIGIKLKPNYERAIFHRRKSLV
tara:strand:+ start:21 stop:404 length:384 start_codon:yes stop_codon:yes gene_type:complete